MRYQVERFLFWVVRVFARLCPRRPFLYEGRLLGRLAYHLDRRHRTIALQNYAVAFPEVSSKEAARLIKQTYGFFGFYLFDLLTCFPKFPAGRMNHAEYEGLDHVEAAYARGKGVLFFTGHWGEWEIMAMAHGFKGYPLGVIARRLDNPHLEHLLATLRTSTGNFVIEKRDGIRPILKALREGKGLAILIDQNVTTDERIFVDFFGKTASTTPALGLLKLKTDAALIPVFALPLPGNRYRFSYGPPVEVMPSGNRDADVLAITQACTNVIEQRIRENPEYWLWMHRRWKTRMEE
jgi:KDO2-lipid IV(A) lauroyltransferase